MDWYVVDKAYINYLTQFDSRVGYVEYGVRLKLHIGIILNIDDVQYYVPISSVKSKHKKMSNSVDFHKIQDEETGFIYAVLNINNMIPVPKSCITQVKYNMIDEFRIFENEKEKTDYIYLLQKEKFLIDKIEGALQNKAKKLYQKCMMKPESSLASRCCSFRLLEEKCKLYIETMMKKIKLCDRTEETVRIYYERAKDKEIKRFLPQKAKSVEEALEDYRKTLLPNATSYGKTIWIENTYIGDIWCYCIDKNEEPNAMISYCIFDKMYWKKGIATEVLHLFMKEISERFQLKSLGAFTYSENTASIRVLEKNSFKCIETMIEDNMESRYYRYEKE